MAKVALFDDKASTNCLILFFDPSIAQSIDFDDWISIKSWLIE
jgi:hypothetical protein